MGHAEIMESRRDLSNVRSNSHDARLRSVNEYAPVKKMKRPVLIAAGAALVGVAIVLGIVLTRSPASKPEPSPPSPASTADPLVEEFRATERTCIKNFNDALRAQRENSIDELELSNTIERDVLVPWRALRTKVEAAPQHDELYATIRKYMEARQISWEAYVQALRSPSDDAAAPHYATHREQNAIAQEHARHLGELFRRP
jgi:hypothetical protein